jgi:hypothetical protein
LHPPPERTPRNRLSANPHMPVTSKTQFGNRSQGLPMPGLKIKVAGGLIPSFPTAEMPKCNAKARRHASMDTLKKSYRASAWCEFAWQHGRCWGHLCKKAPGGYRSGHIIGRAPQHAIGAVVTMQDQMQTPASAPGVRYTPSNQRNRVLDRHWHLAPHGRT